MNTPNTTAPPLTRRERRAAERRRRKAVTIRPVRPGEFNPDLGIPAGSMVIVTELAPGVRHKRLVVPEGGAGWP